MTDEVEKNKKTKRGMKLCGLLLLIAAIIALSVGIHKIRMNNRDRSTVLAESTKDIDTAAPAGLRASTAPAAAPNDEGSLHDLTEFYNHWDFVQEFRNQTGEEP